MIYSKEYSERIEESIMQLPKEIADEIMNDVRLQESDKNFQESDVSFERLCDYVALQYFPEHTSIGRYMSELRDRVIAAPFDEIMAVCKFVASRQKISGCYYFTAALLAAGLLGKPDKEEFVKRFVEAGGLKLLDIENLQGRIVYLSQNSEE